MTKNKNLSSVYVAMRGRLMKAVSHIVPPRDIEDIVQKTYVRACQVESTKTINCAKSFMFVTARNLALDHVKRAENRLTNDVLEESDFGNLESQAPRNAPYEQAVSNSEFASFCDAVRQLPVKCRLTFVLKKVYGYSQKEITKTLNIESHISLSKGLNRVLLVRVIPFKRFK